MSVGTHKRSVELWQLDTRTAGQLGGSTLTSIFNIHDRNGGGGEFEGGMGGWGDGPCSNGSRKLWQLLQSTVNYLLWRPHCQHKHTKPLENSQQHVCKYSHMHFAVAV